VIIGGLQKFSLIDYPHKISAIIFTIGCNMRCPYCHNPELVDPKIYAEKIPEKDVFEFLQSRREKLDAVEITGGEPTLHKDLYQFISKIKSMGFLVKLDTNGTNPNILNKLIKDNLLNYIAMDIKGSLDRYEEIIRTKVDLEKIKESIKIILNLQKSVGKEFRTTVLPKFHNDEEIHKIGKLIAGVKLFVLQKFTTTKTLDLNFLKEKQFSDDQMLKFKNILENYVQECLIR